MQWALSISNDIIKRISNTPKKIHHDKFIKASLIDPSAMSSELHDSKKATYKCMSTSKWEYSWQYCHEEIKKTIIGTKLLMMKQRVTEIKLYKMCRTAVSSICIMPLKSMIGQKINSFTVTWHKKDTNGKWLFHQFEIEDFLHTAIMLVGMENLPSNHE